MCEDSRARICLSDWVRSGADCSLQKKDALEIVMVSEKVITTKQFPFCPLKLMGKGTCREVHANLLFVLQLLP